MHYSSGKEYAEAMIQTILDTQLELDELERIDSKLLIILIDIIKGAAEERYAEYLAGDRETYMFTEEEFMELHNQATYDYIDNMLSNMVDKGVVQVGVGEGGDLLYSLTEFGKHNIKDYIDNNF